MTSVARMFRPSTYPATTSRRHACPHAVSPPRQHLLCDRRTPNFIAPITAFHSTAAPYAGRHPHACKCEFDTIDRHSCEPTNQFSVPEIEFQDGLMNFEADGVVKESWERAGSFALLGFDL